MRCVGETRSSRTSPRKVALEARPSKVEPDPQARCGLLMCSTRGITGLRDITTTTTSLKVLRLQISGVVTVPLEPRTKCRFQFDHEHRVCEARAWRSTRCKCYMPVQVGDRTKYNRQEKNSDFPFHPINFTTPPASLIFSLREVMRLVSPSVTDAGKNHSTYSARSETNRALTMNGNFGS